MSVKVMQWKGVYNNLHELQIVICDKSTDIALQDTHHSTNLIKLNDFTPILSDNNTHRFDAALLIKILIKLFLTQSIIIIISADNCVGYVDFSFLFSAIQPLC